MLMSSNTFQNYYNVNLNNDDDKWRVAQAVAERPSESDVKSTAALLGIDLQGIGMNGTFEKYKGRSAIRRSWTK